MTSVHTFGMLYVSTANVHTEWYVSIKNQTFQDYDRTAME